MKIIIFVVSRTTSTSTEGKMGIQYSQRKSVIVVIDANRSKGRVDAVDWALKNVVRPGDSLVVLGIFWEIERKISCFQLIMGISIAGIWERLEFPGQGEVRPKELGEEIERRKEQYQSSLQQFYRTCRKNDVKLEVKLAAGFCPAKITVEQAQSSKPRWIVLDSQLKRYKLVIFGHVGCDIAVMKGKYTASWLPSKAPVIESAPRNSRRNYEAGCSNLQENEDCNNEVQDSTTQNATPETPCWYPLSWRSGFPRVFTQIELENITNGFSEESLIKESDKVMVYGGLFQETPVLIKRFAENNETFWSMLKILTKVRHRNLMNLVGYCCTGTSQFLLFDLPCMGTVELQFLCNDTAKNMTWEVRWYIALEIGGSLRYLHEECFDGAVAMLTISSSKVAISHGYHSMLCDFSMARWLKVDGLNNDDTATDMEEEKHIAKDIHDYGMFLLELIAGKSDHIFRGHNEDQSLIHWALPLLENGCLSEVMDPRLDDSSDNEVVHHMAQAALLCLKSDSGHRFSMSKVLALVRGDRLVTSDY